MGELTLEALHRLVDAGSFEAAEDDLRSSDPLGYPGYDEALARAREGAGTDESVVAGSATIAHLPVEVVLFSFGFMGGSMGEVAGERIARALERAADRKVPCVLRTATGGARMQEGMRSLVQMPKVVVARSRLAAAAQPLLTILGHPTTGGVLASIASLADYTIAEADSTIGFAGPRVAQRFTGKPLSGRTHTSNTAFRQGLVDEVVPADEVHTAVTHFLRCVAPDMSVETASDALGRDGDDAPDAWETVLGVRRPDRPRNAELIRGVAESLVELRGDRSGADDPAVTTAIARVRGRRAVLVGLEHDLAPGPPAYRKAIRALGIADRLCLPVVTLIDTRGADPSENSEAGGIAWAIAAMFDAMLDARSHVLSIVTGEGGSGGALAFGCGDLLLAFSDSIFSVIGPEGAAEILWRDGGRASDAAALLKLTAHDLKRLGIADEVVHRPLNADVLADVIGWGLAELERRPAGLESRRDRWRNV